MVEIDIEAIEARTDAATKGPWHVERLGNHGYPQRIANDAALLIATTYESPHGVPLEKWEQMNRAERRALGGGKGTNARAANAEFMAAAREDVPRLIAEVRRLREELDRLCTCQRQVVRMWSGDYIDADVDPNCPVCPMPVSAVPVQDAPAPAPQAELRVRTPHRYGLQEVQVSWFAECPTPDEIAEVAAQIRAAPAEASPPRLEPSPAPKPDH